MLVDRLKLRQVVLAVTIADYGSIVRAAEALHITQPVVTRGLRDLEGVLGVELFHRGPRGMSPTVFGEMFLEHGRAILSHVRQADQHLHEMADATAGRVTVGTHLAGSNILLPKAIHALKEKHPGITVVVREMTPDLMRSALLSGEIDITIGRITTGLAPTGLRQIGLYSEPVRAVARKGHPLVAGRDPSFDDLFDYPWIIPLDQTMLRREFEMLFASREFKLPPNRIECTSILTLRNLLVSSDAVAALPFLIAESDSALEILPIQLPKITSTVGLTVSENRHPSRGVRLLMELLLSTAEELRGRLNSYSRMMAVSI
ncbi:LysR substrate-binding domain-containing protein [Nocardia sp. R6R-6]|uniref:LysR substrate-binding domain-containing protein n=1 Tax=Nocardia sp. R6R-6 TaxID=3459303 RepID=UPI00403D7645